jgi:hypothetical protein
MRDVAVPIDELAECHAEAAREPIRIQHREVAMDTRSNVTFGLLQAGVEGLFFGFTLPVFIGSIELNSHAKPGERGALRTLPD